MRGKRWGFFTMESIFHLNFWLWIFWFSWNSEIYGWIRFQKFNSRTRSVFQQYRVTRLQSIRYFRSKVISSRAKIKVKSWNVPIGTHWLPGMIRITWLHGWKKCSVVRISLRFLVLNYLFDIETSHWFGIHLHCRNFPIWLPPPGALWSHYAMTNQFHAVFGILRLLVC